MLDSKSLKAGEEIYETYYSKVLKRNVVEYLKRDKNGRLYVTVKPTLKECRETVKKQIIKNNEYYNKKGY